jgi:Asp-tRNA(Asn)/Glu-tRNA(Gln) amidotransferase A subunit family amidase
MSDALTWLPAWEIRELVAKKEVSPVEVTEHFLGRIEEHESTLRTFTTLDAAGAREQAKQAEEAVSRGDDLGPLHGIPISVKEHITVKGIPMTGLGAIFHSGGPSQHDDISVERLRQAGAVIVGTNTMMATGDVKLLGSPDEMLQGKVQYDWEHEARNPWDPTRVPGWSSSGSASAAAARLLPITIGSDGGGSTRLPAALSGVVGVHPSRGLIPHCDYVMQTLMLTTSFGPLCRDVRDAAITLQAMAGPDGRDFVCRPDEPDDYQATIDLGVEGRRFAWSDDFGSGALYPLEEAPRVIEAVRRAASGFSSLGAEIDRSDEVWDEIWLECNILSRAHEGPLGVGMPRPSAEEYEAAIEVRRRTYDKCSALLSDHDLILSPTCRMIARTVEDWNAQWTTESPKHRHGGFSPYYVNNTALFNWLGWPAIALPCGFVDGLPVSLQIAGRPGSESLIFRAAQAFQKAYPCLDHPTVS